jgi:hypothetical protein
MAPRAAFEPITFRLTAKGVKNPKCLCLASLVGQRGDILPALGCTQCRTQTDSFYPVGLAGERRREKPNRTEEGKSQKPHPYKRRVRHPIHRRALRVGHPPVEGIHREGASCKTKSATVSCFPKIQNDSFAWRRDIPRMSPVIGSATAPHDDRPLFQIRTWS